MTRPTSDVECRRTPERWHSDGSGISLPDGVCCDLAGLHTGNFIDSGQSLGNEMTLSVATGDINGDGAVDVGDGIFVLDYLFAGGASTCRDASDANGDGAVDIGDAIFVLTYLFSGGVEPAPPFPACGEDPTADALECESFDGC